MAISDDAKQITAALLTLATIAVKIDKHHDQWAVNDQSAQQEVMQTFAAMIQNQIKMS